MKTTIGRLACFAALWAGCSSPVGVDSQPADVGARSHALRPELSCESDRAIWRSPRAGACPAVAPSPGGRWTLEAPFGRNLPTELQHYCVYRWTADSQATGGLAWSKLARQDPRRLAGANVRLRPSSLGALKPIRPAATSDDEQSSGEEERDSSSSSSSSSTSPLLRSSSVARLGTVNVAIKKPVLVGVRPVSVLDDSVVPPLGPTSPGADAQPDLADLTRQLRGHSAAAPPVPDCPIVMPAADPEPAQVYEALQSQLWTQAGRADASGLGRQSVRVAVLDTAVHDFYERSDGAEDRDPHGRAVGRIAEDLACAGAPDCPIEIANYLALPFVDEATRDTRDGGHLGTRLDLSLAIYRALRDWGRDVASVPDAPRRLILNLSLAWHPAHGGELGQPVVSLDPASRLVHAMLTRARCLGAVATAAVGNRTGAASDGPMAPATFEALSPDEQCSRYVFGSFDAALPGPPRASDTDTVPVVYAVGAVDAEDADLLNARVNAAPGLVAYGLQAVTSDGDDRTDVLSGSSAATAVASAAFASAWSHHPDADARVVNAAVRAGSVALLDDTGYPRRADFGVSPSSRPVRRISVCGAVEALQCMVGDQCEANPRCSTSAFRSGAPRLSVSDWEPLSPMPWADSAPCSGSLCQARSDADAWLRPWTQPQPTVRGCSLCAFHRDSSVFYGMLTRRPVRAPYLTFGNGDQTRLNATGGAFRASVSSPSSYSRAMLHVPLADGRTSAEPVTVF